jgi:hypothetical protein
MTMTGLKALAVDPFTGPSAERRTHLLEALGRLVVRLMGTGIPCNLYVDGSFLTKKPHPDDIDVMACVDDCVVQAMDDEKYAVFLSLNAVEQVVPGVDSKAFTTYPVGHEHHGNLLLGCGSIAPGAHYGLENGEEYLKGFALLRLLETDVGHRICR